MYKTIKKSWAKALRSGKYIQGRGALHRGDTFCCLGVLCDLFSKTAVGKAANARWEEEKQGTHAFLSREYAVAALPLAVQKWAGLEDSNPELRRGARTKKRHAIGINDSGHFSFKDIAGFIEKNL